MTGASRRTDIACLYPAGVHRTHSNFDEAETTQQARRSLIARMTSRGQQFEVARPRFGHSGTCDPVTVALSPTVPAHHESEIGALRRQLAEIDDGDECAVIVCASRPIHARAARDVINEHAGNSARLLDVGIVRPVPAVVHLSPTEANFRVASMMTHHEHSDVIARCSIEEVVGKPGEGRATQLAGVFPMRLGRLRHRHEMRLQFRVELTSQPRTSYFFVVAHDLDDIRRDLGVKNQTHHLRRRMDVSS